MTEEEEGGGGDSGVHGSVTCVTQTLAPAQTLLLVFSWWGKSGANRNVWLRAGIMTR